MWCQTRFCLEHEFIKHMTPIDGTNENPSAIAPALFQLEIILPAETAERLIVERAKKVFQVQSQGFG